MRSGLLLNLATVLFCVSLQARECLPARVEKDFPARLANAAYMRFSPNADFAIGWGANPEGDGGKTYLVDLRGKQPKVIPTVLSVEAYPVEGDWELLGSAGMGTSYYELSELLKEKLFTSSAFRGSVGGLYHVSGTLLSNGGSKKIIRTVSYDKLEFADIEVEMKDGKVVNSKPVPRKSKYLCANLGKKGLGPELMQVMLSKDGTELVGIPKEDNGHLKLYRVKEDLTCTVEDIPISSQKPMFSHPQPGKKGYIAFHTGAEVGSQTVPFGQVSIYDRDLKKYLRVSMPGDRVVSFSPGTLKDGRVVFIRTEGEGKAKLVIVDPYQATPGFEGQCLEKSAGRDQKDARGVQ